MKNSFVLISFVAATGLLHNSIHAQSNPQQNSQTIQGIKKNVSNSTKILKHANMPMFDSKLRYYPEVLVRINLATQAIKNLLIELNTIEAKSISMSSSEEKNYIATKLSVVLKPISEFFDTINQYRSFVKPLLEESLDNSKTTTSPLMKYFDSPFSLDSFCNKEISSRVILKTFITELLQFFGDLNASLSPETKEAYASEVARLKKSKQNSSSNK